MNHKTLVAIASLALAATAWAQNPHFVRANGTLNTDGEYVASFKEAGLGANQSVHYLLRAGSGTQFTYQCYTRSSNTPHGAPNNVFPSNLQTGGTFSSGRNGQITASLTLTPAPSEDCQGEGLKLCLTAVSYQNVTLEDTTHQVLVNLPSRSETYIGPNNRPSLCEPF